MTATEKYAESAQVTRDVRNDPNRLVHAFTGTGNPQVADQLQEMADRLDFAAQLVDGFFGAQLRESLRFSRTTCDRLLRFTLGARWEEPPTESRPDRNS